MSRKRSIKSRYWRLLKRLCPTPALAGLALFSSSCAAQAAQDTAHSAASSPKTIHAAPHRQPERVQWEEWKPPLAPLELELAPELRSACPFAAVPPAVALEHSDDVPELEPFAGCLAKEAFQLRIPPGLPAVPFRTLVTYPLPAEYRLEIGALDRDARRGRSP